MEYERLYHTQREERIHLCQLTSSKRTMFGILIQGSNTLRIWKNKSTKLVGFLKTETTIMMYLTSFKASRLLFISAPDNYYIATYIKKFLQHKTIFTCIKRVINLLNVFVDCYWQYLQHAH